jgi:ABC-type sugar transport system ATPase subunit
VIGDQAIVLPQRLRSVLRNYHNKDMILGVRPENISSNQFPGQANNAISATVNVIEPLGARTDVYLTNHARQRFIAGIDPHTRLRANDAVEMYVDLEKVHIFKPEGAGGNVLLSNQPD